MHVCICVHVLGRQEVRLSSFQGFPLLSEGLSRVAGLPGSCTPYLFIGNFVQPNSLPGAVFEPNKTISLSESPGWLF